MKMTKKLVAVVLFTASSFPLLLAQIGPYEGIFFMGVTASVQSPKMKFSEDFEDLPLRDFRDQFGVGADYKATGQFGFSLGVNAGANVSEKAGFQLNLTYSNNGYDYEIDELAPGPDADLMGIYRFEERINLIQVNPLLRVQPFGYYTGPYLIFGPSLSMGFSGTKKQYFDDGGGDPILIGEIEELKFNNDRFSQYKGLTAGVVFGLGFSAYINGNTRVVAEVQRQNDFSNLYSSSRLDYLESQGAKIIGKKAMRATSLRVGIEYIIQGDK